MWRNRRSYIQFIRNASATCRNRHMSIDLGSKCKVGCIFCFNNNDLPGVVQSIPLISEEEFEIALELAKPYMCNNIIQIGAGDKIWWGDPLAHPKFTKFIRRIAETYPEAEIHFDTSGFYATREIIDELKQIEKIRIFLSVNTLNQDIRYKFLRQPSDLGLRLMLQELPIHYAFLKHFGNIEALLSDIEELSENQNVKEICLYKLHYTRYNKKHVAEKIKSTQENFYVALEQVYKSFPELAIRIECQWLHNPLDQQSPLFTEHVGFLEKVIRHAQQTSQNGNFILCTGESSYEYLVKQIGQDHVIKVKNHVYGGSITSSGMLVLQDILNAIKRDGIRQGWSYFIPSEVVDETEVVDERGFDRLDVSFSAIARELAHKGAKLVDPKLLTYVY